MSEYGQELYADVFQIQHSQPDSRGSGRLIGRNLIITSKHVVRPGGASVDSGWKCRRIGDRPFNWPDPSSAPWKFLEAKVVYASRSHDLAVLELCAPASLAPSFRTRIATAPLLGERPVVGAGFPAGYKSEERVQLLPPPGTLQDARGKTLIFNVEPAYQPSDPHTDWQGFSGSAIVHRHLCNPKDIWIYGVAQEVPENFTRQICVARLAEALAESEELMKLLSGAGIENLEPGDPLCMPSAKDFPHIRAIGERARKRFASAEVRLMDTRASICGSLDDIERCHRERNSNRQTLTPRDLLKKVRFGDALLMKAPGGCGKSFYLLQILLAGIDEDFVPFFLDLQGVEIRLAARPRDADCEELFRLASDQRWEDLARARERDYRVVIAVDSLNEAKTIDAIKILLGYILEKFGDKLVLIIADRMSDAAFHFRSRTFCTVVPLNPAVVSERVTKSKLDALTAGFKNVLSIPFFLALYEKISRSPTNAEAEIDFHKRTDIMFAYFAICNNSEVSAVRILEEGHEIVSKLAPVAYKGYEAGIRMKDDWLAEELRKTDLCQRRLLDAGLLVASKDDQREIWFSHQLFHDFLAGYHLAVGSDPQPAAPGAPFWRSTNFDVATLRAKSFDALEFAVELVPDKADAFVIEVYDWNYQAAVHLILDLATDGATPEAEKARALRDALIAINSEKKFDPFQHTRTAASRRAVSIAAIHQSPYNDSKIDSHDALLKCVDTTYRYQDLADYQAWKRTFLLTEKPNPRDWGLIQASPLIAWTAANAFRRSVSDGDQLLAYLCGLYDALHGRQPRTDAAIGTRWRIAHVLGAADDDNIVAKLFEIVEREVLTRQTQWVQYGAVRSLVEIAARQAAAINVDAILTRLTAMMGTHIGVETPAFSEIRNVAIPVSPPACWPDCYTAVLERGKQLATAEDRDLWRSRLAELKALSSSSPSCP